MVRTWLADGLDKEELAVVQSLESVARHHETAASSIVTMPFLRTVEEVDVFLLGEFEADGRSTALQLRETSLTPSVRWQASHGWPTGSTSMSAPYLRG